MTIATKTEIITTTMSVTIPILNEYYNIGIGKTAISSTLPSPE